MDLTAADHLEQNREAMCGACRADALESGRLGHVVADHEEIEERWMPESGPQLPLVDDVYMAKQIGVALMISANQVAELAEQRLVVQ